MVRKKGEKATESRGTVTGGVHCNPEFGDTGVLCCYKSADQREAKSEIHPPILKCVQNNLFETLWEEN